MNSIFRFLSISSLTTMALCLVMPVFAQSYLPTQRQKVYIGGEEVVSKQNARRNTIKEDLPDELRSTRTRMALENRHQLKIYSHAPSIGPDDADVTIVEYNDLSCQQCRELSQRIDELRKKHPDHIRHIFIHTPLDSYNNTNPAAFYSRLAHQNNVFWRFRNILSNSNLADEGIYIDSLIASGLDMKTIRQDIRDHSRQFYREIDADAQLARDMNEKNIPLIFINGVRIGQTIAYANMDLLVSYEIEQVEKNN